LREISSLAAALLRGVGLAAISVGGLQAPLAAKAQLPGVVRTGLGFLNTGAYYFSGNAGSAGALGTPKFYNAGGFFSKPHHISSLAFSGGLESINASDHFLPFTGGNEFNLIGPSGRVSFGSPTSRVHPFVTFGLFAGRIRSVNQNFDRTEFTPSGSVGFEFGLSKNFSLIGSYRISQEINRVNTDGFGLSLKIL
jgi:hypothetical protein